MACGLCLRGYCHRGTEVRRDDGGTQRAQRAKRKMWAICHPHLFFLKLPYRFRGPVRSQVRSGCCVGGSFSPGSIVTSRGLRTSPPRGPRSMYSPGRFAISPGFCFLAMIGLLQTNVVHLRTGLGRELFGGRGGRGGFGTGGAGDRGRLGGAGGFGSGLLGGRIGSGIRGIRSLITLALAKRPLCYRILSVETSHRPLNEFVVPPALGGAFLFRLYTAPNRSDRSVLLLDLFGTLPFSYLAEMIYDWFDWW